MAAHWQGLTTRAGNTTYLVTEFGDDCLPPSRGVPRLRECTPSRRVCARPQLRGGDLSEDLRNYLEFCDDLNSFEKLSEFHRKIIDVYRKKISRYAAKLTEA